MEEASRICKPITRFLSFGQPPIVGYHLLMQFSANSRDSEPITRIGNFPVTMTVMLVAIHVLCMIAGTIFAGLNSFLAFSSTDVLGKFSIWKLFTYAFVHVPSLWFLIEMLFFYWFGREVEKFVGRKAYTTAYIVLVLAVSFSAVLLGLATDVSLAGPNLPHLGIFLLFAFIYPNIELIFRLKVKWIALAIIGIYLLMDVNARAWGDMLLLAVTCFAAFETARRLGIGSAMAMAESAMPQNGEQPPPRPPRKPGRAKKTPKKKRRPEPDNIDAILDKIAKSGLSSLTADERDQLEKARKKLLQEDSR